MGNAVVQFEIGGPDDQLLAGFYGALSGWEMTPIPGANYTLIAASETGPQPGRKAHQPRQRNCPIGAVRMT